MGAGDIIMSLVGTALTGLAFVIYKHRASISVPAVAGTALVSSVFSVMATMGASNILGFTAGAFLLASAMAAPTGCGTHGWIGCNCSNSNQSDVAEDIFDGC
jgi:hypothetical protein